ncbi:hypothetical protein [Streptomyces sp. NPDC023838]|uniref:hypothetical protein n=1 Tax=Streptomyces sp. NPDC023838 TaxID=3154325 RepID=UPI003404859C
MILYTDVLTDDELLSDAFQKRQVYEIDCKMISTGEETSPTWHRHSSCSRSSPTRDATWSTRSAT